MATNPPVLPEPVEPIHVGLIKDALKGAYRVLPIRMYTPEATQLLLTIGWQESRFEHRFQVGGPARGFWQFEQGGIRGVWNHETSKEYLQEALKALKYPADVNPELCYSAVAHNDTLAAVYARLLLWTSPKRLPRLTAPMDAWWYYKDLWRPGKPHPETWIRAWDWAQSVGMGW